MLKRICDATTFGDLLGVEFSAGSDAPGNRIDALGMYINAGGETGTRPHAFAGHISNASAITWCEGSPLAAATAQNPHGGPFKLFRRRDP